MERIYLSIGQRFDDDISKHAKITHETTTGGGKITISFSGESEAEILNRIFLIISHLAKLKDHLKNLYISKGGKGNVIENEVNQSEHLKLIIDLDNLEKHGSKKNGRSGKNPCIGNPRRGLGPKIYAGSQSGSFLFNPFTGDYNADNVAIIITAEIKDDKGNTICYLDELINKALQKWKEVIKTHKLIP